MRPIGPIPPRPPARHVETAARARSAMLEAAGKLGMGAQLIRDPSCPKDIIELAKVLGA